MNKHATVQDLAAETRALLSCGVDEKRFAATDGITVRSPINGQPIGPHRRGRRQGRCRRSRPRP